MSKTEIPEDIAALARKIGKQFKSEQDLAEMALWEPPVAIIWLLFHSPLNSSD